MSGAINGQQLSHLPYGEELTATADSRVKFGTYFRNSTGLVSQDHANQRYYNPWFGRFNTPDSRTGNFANPTTWNKYAYSDGDPVNRNDPTGQYSCFAGYGPEGDPEYTECEDESVYLPGSPGAKYICIFWGWGCPDFAALQAMQYYPFAPKSKPDLKFGGDVTKTFQSAWSNAWDDEPAPMDSQSASISNGVTVGAPETDRLSRDSIVPLSLMNTICGPDARHLLYRQIVSGAIIGAITVGYAGGTVGGVGAIPGAAIGLAVGAMGGVVRGAYRGTVCRLAGAY